MIFSKSNLHFFMAFSLFAYPWKKLFLTLLVVRMACQSVRLWWLKMHGEKMAPKIPVPKSMMDICDLCPIVCARTISPSQKWWQGVLEMKVPCSQWEGLPCTLEGSSFCLLGEDARGKGILFPSNSQCVPMGFSKSSSIFQVVPQDVPNSTSLLSLMVCRKFNSHAYRLKRWAIREHICFYFETWGPKNHFNWGVPNVQILLDDGLINMAPSKKKKREKEKKEKVVSAPMIIQITLCPTDNKGCRQ